MAMLPFCGYHIGDYFKHWLDMGKRIPKPPKIFNVNWFRTGADGKFLWPGYGENLRALLWILQRCEGAGKAVETPIGYIPPEDALDINGLNIRPETMKELLNIDKTAWLEEAAGQKKFFDTIGDRLPQEMTQEWKGLNQRLGSMSL